MNITHPAHVIIDRLAQAKSFIEEYGWCQGNYRNDLGQFCVMGAVQTACADSYSTEDDVLEVLRSSLLPNGVTTNTSLVAWNDMDTRRKRDVVRLFDRAIRNVEAATKS